MRVRRRIPPRFPLPKTLCPGESIISSATILPNGAANIATYNRIRYADVYPGIDLIYYGTEGKLEYDFAVAPGVRAETSALSFEGARPSAWTIRGS